MSQHFYAGPTCPAPEKPKDKKDPWKDVWATVGIVVVSVWGTLLVLYPLWHMSRALWRSFRHY